MFAAISMIGFKAMTLVYCGFSLGLGYAAAKVVTDKVTRFLEARKAVIVLKNLHEHPEKATIE